MNSLISQNSQIGKNVQIGHGTIIKDNVIIGDDTVIGPYCILGETTNMKINDPLVIGPNSNIRSHSVFYVGSQFGKGLQTGHSVNVRDLVFAGESLQIGSFSDFQGDLQIGNFVRTQTNVFLGRKTILEDYVWVLPYAVFTNDPHPPSEVLVGARACKFSVISASAVIMPGITLGEHSVVGAASVVTKDVPSGMLAFGQPAKIIGRANQVDHRALDKKAYPWPEHFSRGYPSNFYAPVKILK